MDLGAPELILILVIVVVLFGSGRVAKLGSELGQGLREFRKGLAGEEGMPSKATTSTANSIADPAVSTDVRTKS